MRAVGQIGLTTFDPRVNRPSPCARGFVARHLTTSCEAHAISGDDAKYYVSSP